MRILMTIITLLSLCLSAYADNNDEANGPFVCACAQLDQSHSALVVVNLTTGKQFKLGAFSSEWTQGDRDGGINCREALSSQMLCKTGRPGQVR